jgi:hypothetical protein
MIPADPIILAARMCQPDTSWAKRVRHYETLLAAGIPADEAERIIPAAYQEELRRASA